MSATTGVHGLLITGDKRARDEFYRRVYDRLNYIQQRQNTAHYTCMAADLSFALGIAGEHGLTVQEICHEGGQESYPVLAGPGPGWQERRCRVCGCTDNDCSGCIERTGHPCHWVTANLCSACA